MAQELVDHSGEVLASVHFRDLLQPGPANPSSGAHVLEYTCIDATPTYLICGSNTGVVDIYRHGAAKGGGCQLVKTLAPPRNSKHVNVKVTCVRMGAGEGLLAVGNILGNVNIIHLDFREGGKAQKVVHNFTHEGAVRCLTWSDDSTRLYSGCDAGIISETRVPKDYVVAEGGTVRPEAGSKLSSVTGFSALKGPLFSLFQNPSTTVLFKENSEILQLDYVPLPESTALSLRLDCPERPTWALVATHATRCNVHFVLPSLGPSRPYSVQVEGDKACASSRTIYGGNLVLGREKDHATNVLPVHLFVSRPEGRLWKVDLGSSTGAVATLSVSTTSTEQEPQPQEEGRHQPQPQQDGQEGKPAALPPPPSGRLYSTCTPHFLVSWWPGKGLRLVNTLDVGAFVITDRSVHNVAVVCDGRPGRMSVFLLHGDRKAVGAYDMHFPGEEEEEVMMTAPLPVTAPLPGADASNGGNIGHRRKKESSSSEEVGSSGGGDGDYGDDDEAAKVLQRAWRRRKEDEVGLASSLTVTEGSTSSRPSSPGRSQEEGEEGEGGGVIMMNGGLNRRQHDGMMMEMTGACEEAARIVQEAGGGLSGAEREAAMSTLTERSGELVRAADEIILAASGGESKGQKQWETGKGGRGREWDGDNDDDEEEDEDKEGEKEQKAWDGKRPVYESTVGRWKARQKVRSTGKAKIEALEEGEVVQVARPLTTVLYEVSMSGPSGLGLDLGFKGSSPYVRAVLPLPDGSESPAQRSGKISAGDWVVAVDGQALELLSMEEKVQLLMTLRKRAQTEVHIVFSAASVAQALSLEQRLQQQQQEEEDDGEEEEREEGGMVSPKALQQQQQEAEDAKRRAAIGVLGELGLVLPASFSAVAQLEQLLQEQGDGGGEAWEAVGQAIKSRLLMPWGGVSSPSRLRGGHVMEEERRRRKRRRRWGEFRAGEQSMGLVMAPEEMNDHLQEIADDVLRVVAARAKARESRFYEDPRFSRLLREGGGQADHEHQPRGGGGLPSQHIPSPVSPTEGEFGYFKSSIYSLLGGGGGGPASDASGTNEEVGGGGGGGKPSRKGSMIEDDEEDEEVDSYSHNRGDGSHNISPNQAKVFLEAIPLADLLEETGRTVGEDGPSEACDLEEATDVISDTLGTTMRSIITASSASSPWPPIQLTHVTAMTLVVRHMHALLPESETMLQEWIRCFTPLPPAQRHIVWEGSVFLGPHTHPEDVEMVEHHQKLTCELVTLFFLMHTVWPLLDNTGRGGRDDGDNDEAHDLRLRVGWENGTDEMTGLLVPPSSSSSSSSSGRRAMRPSQWSEEEALVFLDEYGAYVEIEATMKACLARGWEAAIKRVTEDLAPRHGFFQKGEEAIYRILADVPKERKAHLHDMWQEEEASLLHCLRESSRHASLCMAVALLPRLQESWPQLLSGVCRAMYPDLRPWLVRRVLSDAEDEQGWRVYVERAFERRVLQGRKWKAMLWEGVVEKAPVEVVVREAADLGLEEWRQAVVAVGRRKKGDTVGVMKVTDAIMRAMEEQQWALEDKEKGRMLVAAVLQERLKDLLGQDDDHVQASLAVVGAVFRRLISLHSPTSFSLSPGDGDEKEASPPSSSSSWWEVIRLVLDRCTSLGPQAVVSVLLAGLTTTQALDVVGRSGVISTDRGFGLGLLRAIMAEHLRELRRRRMGEEMLMQAKATMWRRKARDRMQPMVPPGIAGLAMLEAFVPPPPSVINAGGTVLLPRSPSSPSRRYYRPPEVDDDGAAEVPSPSSPPASSHLNPVEGVGALGVMMESCSSVSCGVCNLRIGPSPIITPITTSGAAPSSSSSSRPFQPSSSASNSSNNNNNNNNNNNSGDSATLFACGHGYHTHCLPENACVLCLREHFEPF